MTPINRRLLLAAGGLTSAAALAGCSSGGGDTAGSGGPASPVSQSDIDKALDTPTELTFWTWLPQMEDEVALFMKAYPKIKVKVQNVGQGTPQYQKLRTALKAGSGGPDVVQIEYQYISSFSATKSLLDLAPYGATDLKSQFVDWVWKQVAPGDGSSVWGIPQDSGPMGFLYRKDILDKAGVKEAPKTWDDYRKAAQAVRSKTDSYISDFQPNGSGAFVGLLWQAGARPFGYDGEETVTLNLTGDASKKVAEFWQGMVQDGLVDNQPGNTDAYNQSVANGKYAGIVTAAWEPVFLKQTAKNTAGKWRAAPLPQWSESDNVTGNFGGSSNAVLKMSKHPIVAYELAKWINTNAKSTLMFANKQFLFPTTTATLQNDGWRNEKSSFYGGQKVHELFAKISETVDPEFQWLPFMLYAYTQFNQTVGKATTNKTSLVDALSTWQSVLSDYAKQQGFTVK